MVRCIESCGYRHLAVNNRLYLDRLSVLMPLAIVIIFIGFPLVTYLDVLVPMRNGDEEVFRVFIYAILYVETYGTINYETTY